MIVTYDYTDSRLGPPANYEVEVESDAEVRKVIEFLLSAELNRGMQPHKLRAVTDDIKFRRR